MFSIKKYTKNLFSLNSFNHIYSMIIPILVQSYFKYTNMILLFPVFIFINYSLEKLIQTWAKKYNKLDIVEHLIVYVCYILLYLIGFFSNKIHIISLSLHNSILVYQYNSKVKNYPTYIDFYNLNFWIFIIASYIQTQLIFISHRILLNYYISFFIFFPIFNILHYIKYDINNYFINWFYPIEYLLVTLGKRIS